MKPDRRVAITGIGMVTPVGNDTASTWAALQAAESGVDTIQSFDPQGFVTRIGAEVKGFEADVMLENVVDRGQRRHESWGDRVVFQWDVHVQFDIAQHEGAHVRCSLAD